MNLFERSATFTLELLIQDGIAYVQFIAISSSSSQLCCRREAARCILSVASTAQYFERSLLLLVIAAYDLPLRLYYSALFVVPHTQGAQAWITEFYLQSTPCLPLPRKRSPDGASTDCCGGHLLQRLYSFIYPERMKG